MFAKVSSARSVSRCRLLSRSCDWCTAIATGMSTTTFQGCAIASSASVAPSPASPALGDESRIEALACANDVEEERARSEVGERERDERDQVVEEDEAADVSAGELERNAAGARGDRIAASQSKTEAAERSHRGRGLPRQLPPPRRARRPRGRA